ncbi:MAG: hypothetical protein JOY80_08285 [Candidatus Dormibacteraeota bacterium]|nr:hypothetical protein [Candidatus Dormibacteraeota bacterium]
MPPATPTASGPVNRGPEGTVLAWGLNDRGNLGIGSRSGPQTCGMDAVPCATHPTPVVGPTHVTSIAAGGYYAMALDADGNVLAWGDNQYGELGNGTTDDQAVPTRVSGLAGVTAIAAAPADELGSEHSLALESNGTVWAWGDNLFGEVGDGSTTERNSPVQVHGLSDVTAIAAGGEFSLALKGDGSIWAWGDNREGKLGIGIDNSPRGCAVEGGRESYPCATTPVRILALAGVVALAAGATHSLAVRGDGGVWAWGDSTHGELGVGDAANAGGVDACCDVPTRVPGLPAVTAVAAGDFSSLALTARGTVLSWGDNSTGELGDGTTTERDTPVLIPGLTDVRAISMGSSQSLALVSAGTVVGWGDNSEGQLGDGTSTERETPFPVPGLSGVTAVATALEYSLALRVN